MGDRNEYILNDEREDAAMRRMLTQHMEPLFVEPPPDLVTRTARRLPRATPRAASRATARKRTIRAAAVAVAALLVLLVAVAGALDVLGLGPQLVSLFGDGSSGISKALLVARLLVKPVIGTFFTTLPTMLLASSVVAVMGGWLWWLLARQPVYRIAEEARQ